ncbi:fluoride efflux transporter CrcB [bacterium]|nr:fluoride efflux transporter CrcB [bacterium]
MIFNIFAVFIGGGAGALLRYLVTVLCRQILNMPFLGTFFVNIVGCLLIGYLFGFTANKSELLPHALRIFLTVGFLGGLTTFSTFNLEVFNFIKDGKIVIGFIYLILSCVIGLSVTFAGYCIAK